MTEFGKNPASPKTPAPRTGNFRLLRLVLLLSSVAAVLCAFSFSAVASAGAATLPTTPTAAGQTAVLPFSELGLSQSYTFAGGGESVSVQLPVPQALVPTAMAGTLIIPPDFGTGTLVVQSGTTFISSFQLPVNSPQQQTIPFSLALANIPVVNGSLSYTISMQQAGGGVPNVNQSGTCGGSGILPLTMTDISADYAGSFASPTSIADFFPPVMSSLTIYVPSTPTVAEEQTALRIAAGAARSYNLVPVDITVSPWDSSGLPPAPSDELARAILIQEGTTTGISVPDTASGSRVMVLTGNSNTLPQQGTLLNSTIASVVQTRQAMVVKPFAAPTVTAGSQTFAQLGIAGTSTFSGTQLLNLNFSEAKLGGVVSSMAMDIQANYTPLEPNAKGTVQATSGGVVLATGSLDGSGVLNLPVTVPGPLITRTTQVILAVSYFPVGFSCSGISRTMTFTLNPRSTVTPTLSSGGAGGFAELPQSLVPTFQVSLDQDDWEPLNAAVQTVCGIQRISTVALNPSVVPLSTSKNNSLPVLVVGSSQNLTGDFTPPLAYRGGSLYSVASQAGGQVRMMSPVAAIQVFDDTTHNRTVVQVSTTGSWALLDSLFTYLGPTAQKWSTLTGDVLATGASGNTVNLTVASGGAQVFTASKSSDKSLFELGLALFVVIVVILALWAVVRYRRRGMAGPTRQT